MIFQLGEIGSLIHLLVMALLALLYVRWRAVVILPAVMLSSIFGAFIGLEVHPFLMAMVNFAAPLLVFVAGLELKPEFVAREKERVAIMGLIEAALFLTFFYTAPLFLPLEAALTISTLIVASNEMFAIQVSKLKGEELGLYGITLSVLEDVLAVFLLSIGFFTFSTQLTQEEAGLKIATIIALIPILYLLSDPFDKLIDRVENMHTKIILTILYLMILVAISEVPHIPEVLVVFIGAVMLSIRRFDPKAFNAVENYLSLALIGFVATLPYIVPVSGFVENPWSILMIVAGGLAFAFTAFIVRGLFVFLASLLSGLSLDYSLALALTLGNTGEFGLIVVSFLVTTTKLISPTYAFMAMFAYAFNLTLVSFITWRVGWFSSMATSKLGGIVPFLESISEGGDRFVRLLSGDVRLKRAMTDLALVTIIGYSAMTVYKAVNLWWLNYILSLITVSSFLVALQRIFQEFSTALSRSKRIFGVFSGFIKFFLLYIVVAPLINFISASGGRGELAQLSSPLYLVLVLATTYAVSKLIHVVTGRLVSSPGESSS